MALKHAVQVVGYLNLVAYATLALVAFRQWRDRTDRAAAWAAACFGTLGVVVLVGRLVPSHVDSQLETVAQRFLIVVLLLFPYLLFRFATAFDPASRRVARAAGLATAGLAVWTCALPRFPAAGAPRPAGFVVYLVAFLALWAALLVTVAWRLWSAGRGQPSVARRRMQLLAIASGTLALALLLAGPNSNPDSPLALGTGLLGFLSAFAFWLGLAPPRLARAAWRRPEQARVQEAIGSLMKLATSQEEVAGRVLGPMAALVGAQAVAIRNDDGEVVGSHNVPFAGSGELDLAVPGGALTVWTTPYAPFFGDEELAMLRTLGALTGLALDRVRLFEREREARVALERADEVKSNFVALAAHELRGPVGGVHGVAQTLVAHRAQLDDDRRARLEESLLQQTAGLSALVEQLLDLSRLDAEAIPIDPRPLHVRPRVDALVESVAGERARDVTVEIDPGLAATLDAEAFDRIVSNLIANAMRYGAPPVAIRAEQRDRHLRITVEDRGPGVPAEFVPNLFERFTRSEATRELAAGTGLGLAIARSYAIAHRGDLRYEPAEPHGARFLFVVPADGPGAA